jgi:hypothetical protein
MILKNTLVIQVSMIPNRPTTHECASINGMTCDINVPKPNPYPMLVVCLTPCSATSASLAYPLLIIRHAPPLLEEMADMATTSFACPG